MSGTIRAARYRLKPELRASLETRIAMKMRMHGNADIKLISDQPAHMICIDAMSGIMERSLLDDEALNGSSPRWCSPG
eukprot:scaffold3251_cov129-Isochrysis_galbana.AAC.1